MAQHGDSATAPPTQELVLLPVSAIEVGLLPFNQGILTAAFHLMVALCYQCSEVIFRMSAESISGGVSIMERKVVFQSKKFFEEGKN